MTTVRKSFVYSLLLHALMGSLAFIVLTRMHTPPPMVKIPLQPMALLSLSDRTPAPSQPETPRPNASVASPQPARQNPMIFQPIPSPKSISPQPLTQTPPAVPGKAITPTPAVSAPPLLQRSVQYADAAPPPQQPKIDSAAEKRAFFTSLRSTIQSHLRYPSAARRRGMEGEVDVRFTLTDDGTISAISIQRGEEIFHNAVKNGVASASGIDVPKNLSDSLPMEIELTLEFKLNS